MLSNLPTLPADPILSLAARVSQDDRCERVDLGIGVYRWPDGSTPVMHAVKAAEQLLVEHQKTKAYLTPEGDRDFVAVMLKAAFGEQSGLDGIQTVGGTGALSVAARIIKQVSPSVRVIVGVPTWPNHIPILRDAGCQIVTYEHRAASDGSLDVCPILNAISQCRPGDVVLLHGCCHNPTGVDPDVTQWREIAAALRTTGALPLVDLAYQGLGRGWEEDGASCRLLMEEVPEILIAYSCSKNFGLYRDRAGILAGRANAPIATGRLVQHFAATARIVYSMPPDHGAAVVRTILQSDHLRSVWRNELRTMRRRLTSVRSAFAMAFGENSIAASEIKTGLGMFAQLPISPESVGRLARDHAIYMPPSGRVNLAALTPGIVARFAGALAGEVLEAVS